MVRMAIGIVALMSATLCASDACNLIISSKHVDFPIQHDIRCMLTAEGDALWRLRSSKDGGFAERGAAQSLAAWMGEEIQCAPQQFALA